MRFLKASEERMKILGENSLKQETLEERIVNMKHVFPV